ASATMAAARRPIVIRPCILQPPWAISSTLLARVAPFAAARGDAATIDATWAHFKQMRLSGGRWARGAHPPGPAAYLGAHSSGRDDRARTKREVAMAGSHGRQADVIPHWDTGLVELATGVYAYMQAGGGFCVSNAGLVTGAGGSVAVD